ncbi:hypothetical protein [Fulvivirga lutimaris]|uniref:hypothetical protein n=1 Tax=Fulvivirga lutimaris TaxID=1819566 RepID=UPI0012BC542C|nr:hypothetical protein [Fulvivirga lutimaris]MTI40037.1 hypothetical protein [Fulvivirga lutimaris]
MTLQEALQYLRKLESEAKEKSEIMIYQNFIHILTNLENRDFSENEVQTIETELTALESNSDTGNKKRHFRKVLQQFKRFLNDTFSLITKGHYTNMGLGLGASFGVVFGIVILSNFERSLGISFGITIGMTIGLIIGKNLDSQAQASGRII